MKPHDWQWISITNERKWNAEVGPHAPTAFTYAYLSALPISANEEIGLLVLHNSATKTLLPLSLTKINGQISAKTPYGVQGWLGQSHLTSYEQPLINFCKTYQIITIYIACKPSNALTPKQYWFDSKAVFPHHCIYEWHLEQRPNQRMFNSHTSHRRAMRKWLASDSRWMLQPSVLKSAFLSLYPDFIQHRKATHLYHFPTTTLAQWLEHPNCLLIGAGIENKVEAVGWYWLDKPAAHYFLFAATEEGRKHSRAIHFMAAELLYQSGHTHLNLGGGLHPNDNLARFKQRFGADSLQGWSIKAIMNPSLYSQLGGKPPSKSDYFPSYSGLQNGMNLAPTRESHRAYDQ